MTFLILALLIMPAILGGKNLTAQTYSPQTQHADKQQPRRAADVGASVTFERRPTTSDAAAAHPPAAAAPVVPANQPPNPAIVRWGDRGLEIEASNSSLDQILHQVAAETGAKLEGPIKDQRIFGTYGPGPGCDVLSKLLEGSGYNVLLLGSHDADMPLEIVLSARSPAGPQVATNNRSSSYSEPEPDRRPDDSLAQTPPTNQDPFNIGGPPRDQAKMMQEILQRQNVIDQQQQQQQDQRNNLQQ